MRVSRVAFGVKCAYSCMLGAFGPTSGATRPSRRVLRTARLGGGAKQGAGGLKLSYAIHTHAHTHTQTHIYIYIYIYGITTAVCLPGYRGKRWAWVRE